MSKNHVVIVLCTCQHIYNVFGIRFEEFGQGIWIGTWAFAIRESAARREGYDKFQITGNFRLDETYPGCPYCKAKNVFKCNCGKIICWDGITQKVFCPVCKQSGLLSSEPVKNLSAGNDG